MLGKRGWIVVVAVSVLLLGLSLVIVQVRGGKAAPEVRPEVGFTAPDFALPGLDGQTVRLSYFRGKKAVFLNFWATWCPPCRLEMPTMETAYQEYKSRRLEILAVSIDAGP
ncbi:MAG: redoxin domain-containing protein, partial [Acidobacteriota bacterium]